jgi:hypothetical protein
VSGVKGTFAWLGALLIGVGLGMLFDRLVIGLLIGAGVGFILWDLIGGTSFWKKHG